MKKAIAAASPETYVDTLDGWRRSLVDQLRRSTLGAGTLQEQIKWGHLVYFHNGPVLLIRAEEQRVLFGFWRGQRLQALEPRLKSGGKYEMATITLKQGDAISGAQIERLVKAAIDLNAELGDPTATAASR